MAYVNKSDIYKLFDESNGVIKFHIADVDMLPTADVVEVVRCKDCKKFIEYSDDYKFKVEGADGDCHIRLMHSTDNQFCAVKYDDFCSYGERKNDFKE